MSAHGRRWVRLVLAVVMFAAGCQAGIGEASDTALADTGLELFADGGDGGSGDASVAEGTSDTDAVSAPDGWAADSDSGPTDTLDVDPTDGADSNDTADIPTPEPPWVQEPNLLDQEQLFVCDDAPASSPSRIRRIEAKEWRDAIRSDNALKVPLLPATGHRYSTYSKDETLDAPTIREFMRYTGYDSWTDVNGNSHPRLAILRNGEARELAKCFQWNWNGQPVEVDPSDGCISQFVRTLLEQGVFFRPATDDEVAYLAAFAKAQIVKEQSAEQTRKETIRIVLQAAWMSTGALFRPEMGEIPDGERRRLGNWELARSLAFALTDTPMGVSKPGYGDENDAYQIRLGDIFDAASDGTIQDAPVREALVRKYLAGLDPTVAFPASPSTDYPPGSTGFQDQYWTSPKLQRFFREWLDYADAHAIFKDTPEATSAFTDKSMFDPEHPYRHRGHHDQAYNDQNLVSHLDDMIARIVNDDLNVFAELLTSRRFLLNNAGTGPDGTPYSATLYNINTHTSGGVGPDLADRWRDLPAAERAGVLTHPAWLAAHAGNFENDPSAIHRGKWVYEELLCGVINDLPVGVNAMLDPSTTDQSARQRLTEQLDSDPFCTGCHSLMNPIGYTFEIYNHAGFIRVDDHGSPPNGSSTIPYLPGGGDAVLTPGLSVNSAVELMETVAQSPRAKRCFIRQSFRYFAGRNETYADACALQQMESAYDGKGSMVDMLVALFQSDAFLYRHDEVTP